MRPETIAFPVILTLTLAAACTPAPAPPTEGERAAVSRLETDLIGAWSCGAGGDFPFTMTLNNGGEGAWSGVGLTATSKDGLTQIEYDFEARARWRVTREGVKPYLNTQIKDFDIVVIDLSYEDTNLARNRKAVEIAKTKFANAFRGEAFKNNIARLSSETLMLFSFDGGRVICERIPHDQGNA